MRDLVCFASSFRLDGSRGGGESPNITHATTHDGARTLCGRDTATAQTSEGWHEMGPDCIRCRNAWEKLPEGDRLMVMNPEASSSQPFRGDQRVILERRTANGTLDLSGAQPPAKPMRFMEVYDLYFADVPDSSPVCWSRRSRTNTTDSAGWNDLRAWLESKSWTVRACTW